MFFINLHLTFPLQPPNPFSMPSLQYFTLRKGGVAHTCTTGFYFCLGSTFDTSDNAVVSG